MPAKKIIDCRLCGKKGKAVKAHIIPRAFFQSIKDYPGEILEVHVAGKRRERSPIGEYDPDILCAKCEMSLHEYDDYAVQLLLRRQPPPENLPDRLLFRGIDYRRLKLFFLSLLWRASVSNRRFSTSVKLPKRDEQFLADVIRRNKPPPFETFGVMIFVYEHQLNQTIMSPRHQLIQGSNFIVFLLPLYKAFIKVSGSIPPLFRKITLGASADLLVPKFDYERSYEHRILQDEKNWSLDAFSEFRDA